MKRKGPERETGAGRGGSSRSIREPERRRGTGEPAERAATVRRPGARAGVDSAWLVARAREAQRSAYAPYSGYRVGAALLARDGRVFLGCNVENASYGLAICAERVAMVKAISEGARAFSAIAIVVPGSRLASPCGACRQFLFEFGARLIVVLAGSARRFRTTTLDLLLPGAFGPAGLESGGTGRSGAGMGDGQK